MAAKKKSKQQLDDLTGHSDPQAPLDGKLLLHTAQPILKALADDLWERAKTSPAVTAALSERHAAEVKKQHTADPYDVWLRFFVKQVAAAWLLSCVFVRVLEDRGLVDQHRIAGPGALDNQQLFFELAPSLSERDYLLTIFRELSRLPAAADLFDARHNPVWLLAPSADGAKKLLQLFRTPTANEPALRFGQADTRFLGNLYQDLDEDVRERFALLQTPHFVESFILDRTLERAIDRFGLHDTTLIDPTCGSGHFLLGAFDRLFEHRLKQEPGLDVREVAKRALDAVYGSDINPYAVAIARFRLTLSFLDKAGYKKLAQAPKLPLHLAVADSLLHNPQRKVAGQKGVHEQAQLGFGQAAGQSEREWEGELFALEDEAATRDVLYRQHAAVVGNPPYITPKDPKLRETYRGMYCSAVKQYHLSAPFTERFFHLTRSRGYVGLITDNAFMKREYGEALVKEFFPTVNINLIVNCSGAFIPGHGTPTVLLFGTAEVEQGSSVLAVLAKRGEPSPPSDPARGLVWSSIADHWADVGYEDDYVSVAEVDRPWLHRHPWILAGGGAIDLFKTLEARADKRLSDVIQAVGRTTVAGEDDLWIGTPGTWARFGLGPSTVPLVIGECVRDWGISDVPEILYPYDRIGGDAVGEDHPLVQMLWPWRTLLWNRTVFGKRMRTAGRKFYEHLEHYSDKLRTPLSITFAFVATHNHFVLDRGGKVFNRSAPIIKLPESATEDDHLALLAYLNSSTACFWMKQVFHDKGSGTDTGKWQDDPAKIAYEFAGTQMGNCPIPVLSESDRAQLAELARACLALADARLRNQQAPISGHFGNAVELAQTIAVAEREDSRLLANQIGIQEQIDWLIYARFGLTTQVPPDILRQGGVLLGQRPFELRLLRKDALAVGTDGQILGVSPDPGLADVIETLAAETDQNPELRVIEAPDYKRRWTITPKHLAGRVLTFREQVRLLLAVWLADQVEVHLKGQIDAAATCPVTAKSVSLSCERDRKVTAVLEWLGTAKRDSVGHELAANAVPFLASLRLSAAGLEKRTAWERAWEAQRLEDLGHEVLKISVPPKYEAKDFRDDRYFDLRGKLDVPKERFISYPGCESDEDKEPVYGWAGWNHLQQAQALAALYQARKTEGWQADRLTPMLAGLLELLPWLKQWHNEPSAEFDGLKLGDYFDGFLEGECAALGVTRDQLRAWRPAAKARGGAKSGSTKRARKLQANARDTDDG